MTTLLAVATVVGLSSQQAYGLVEGYVRSAGEERPLARAVVVVDGDSATLRAVTDASGRYVLRDVPAGTRHLLAHRLGHAPLEIQLVVPAGGRMRVDFLLPPHPFALPVVLAEAWSPGGPTRAPAREGSGEGLPASGAVRVVDATTGLSELGILAGARALQGPRPRPGESVVFVRGTEANLNLVLLDGAPVHTPFHLGGLLDSPVSSVIAHATRHQGGAPARYDGGLSEVLRLESRSAAGTRPRGTAFADFLSAGGVVQSGAGDRIGVLAGGRALHGAGAGPFMDGPFPQRYADGLLRLDVRTTPRSQVSATGFFNRESISLSSIRSARTTRAEWGNSAASIRFRRVDPGSSLAAGAALGEFRTDFPLGAGGTVLAEGRVRRARVTADAERTLGGVRLGGGAQIERVRLHNRFSGVHRLTQDFVQLATRRVADSYAAYVDGEWKVSSALRLGAGLRGTLFGGDRGRTLAPRGRAEWKAAPGVTLDLSAGRFHQLVVTPDTAFPLSLAFFTSEADESLGEAFTDLRVAEATHVVVGVGHERPGLEFRLEGHWKELEGLPGLGDDRLRTTGLDLWVRHVSDPLTVWATYTLAWALADGRPREERFFSGRHFLRGGAAARLAGRLRVEGDLAFGSGLEFGAIPGPGLGGGTSAEPAPGALLSVTEGSGEGGPVPPDRAYVQLGFRVTSQWRARVFGVETELHPYVRVINALDRADALFFGFEGESEQPRPLGAVPVLPVIGLEWRW